MGSPHMDQTMKLIRNKYIMFTYMLLVLIISYQEVADAFPPNVGSMVKYRHELPIRIFSNNCGHVRTLQYASLMFASKNALQDNIDDEAKEKNKPRYFQDERNDVQHRNYIGNESRPSNMKTSVEKRTTAMVQVATTTDFKSLAHASMGAISLLVGGLGLIFCLLYGFNMPISHYDVFFVSFIHIVTAALGATKITWSKGEATRDFIMFSVVPTNAILSYLALSNITQEDSKAIFAISSEIGYSIMLSLSVLFALQLSKVWNEQPDQGGQTFFYGTQIQNVITIASAYQSIVFMIIAVLLSPVFVGVHSHGETKIFDGFLSSFPDYTFMTRNICMNTMFSNNVGVFVATLFKYKVLTNGQDVFGFVVLLLNLVISIFTIRSFVTIDNGQMTYEWFRLLTS